MILSLYRGDQFVRSTRGSKPPNGAVCRLCAQHEVQLYSIFVNALKDEWNGGAWAEERETKSRDAALLSCQSPGTVTHR
jgi:hypothetical protein